MQDIALRADDVRGIDKQQTAYRQLLKQTKRTVLQLIADDAHAQLFEPGHFERLNARMIT